MRKAIRIPSVIALVALIPNLALAQVPPPPSGSAPEPAPAAAPAPAPQAELSEEEKLNRAKTLYGEGEEAYAAGDYVTATQKYEEAYYLFPGKHGFAHKVGIAAWAAGDCVKADEYLRHFTTYATGEKYEAKLEEAKKILGEIAIQGCAAKADPEPAPMTAEPTPEASEDAPILTSRSSEREKEAEKARREAASNKRGGLFIGGLVLTIGGGLAVGGGLVTLFMARGNANALAEASSNNTATGFPTGDYSDSATYRKDQNLDTLNLVTPILLGAGGLMVAGGAVMLVLDAKKRKGGGGKNAKANGAELSAIGPTMLPGGAGASATVKF
jgi:hypothetical protein